MSEPALILAVITRSFQISNYVEAGLWAALGIACAARSFRSRAVVRMDLAVLAVTLIVFGLSDVIEVQTGAWWRPPWLLAMKAACLAVMLVLAIRFVRRRSGS